MKIYIPAIQRLSEAYTTSLRKLALTSKNGSLIAREHGEKLDKLASGYAKNAKKYDGIVSFYFSFPSLSTLLIFFTYFIFSEQRPQRAGTKAKHVQ